MAQSPYLDQNAPEILALERQKKLADLLQARALEQPQGQMVSGRFVAPSLVQQLAPLANAYMGRKASEEVESKQAKLANLIRGQETQEINTFNDLLQGGKQGEAFKFAAMARSPELKKIGLEKMLPQRLTVKEGEEVFDISPTGEKTSVAKGQGKAHVVGNALIVDGKEIYRGRDKPIQIDTGTAIQFIDPETRTVIFSTPKQHVFAPHASQILDTPSGQMAYNPNTQKVTPIMVDGQPLPPKLTSEQSKDITSVNQQRATINGAIKDVENHPEAFSFKRGMAQSMPYGETIAGRLESPEQTQTRAYVFNNVSSVIKERAGTAQTAGELQRINSFLPGPNDNSTQIVNKLKGFNKYLDDLEKGTRISPNAPQKPVENDLVSQAKAELERRKGK
jgi:hypothetical protein